VKPRRFMAKEEDTVMSDDRMSDAQPDRRMRDAEPDGDRMNDAQPDRDIQRAVAVEPPSGSVSRARALLAAARQPRFQRIRWVIVGAAAMAAALFLFALQRSPAPQETVIVWRDVPLTPAPRLDVKPSTTARQTRGASGSRQPRTAGEPEVLIPQAEIDGLKQMMIAVREGQIPAATLLSESSGNDVTLSVPEIQILPLVIEPIED
jgi:hypothetical protein